MADRSLGRVEPEGSERRDSVMGGEYIAAAVVVLDHQIASEAAPSKGSECFTGLPRVEVTSLMCGAG